MQRSPAPKSAALGFNARQLFSPLPCKIGRNQGNQDPMGIVGILKPSPDKVREHRVESGKPQCQQHQ